jgi:hypothetical protein
MSLLVLYFSERLEKLTLVTEAVPELTEIVHFAVFAGDVVAVFREFLSEVRAI